MGGGSTPVLNLLPINSAIATCHIQAHRLVDSNRDNCTGTCWVWMECCISRRRKGIDRLLTSTWPARNTLVLGRFHCKRSEVHNSCRLENSSIRLWDILHDLCNKLRLHFWLHMDRTRKILMHKLVLPALMRKCLLTCISFSHASPKI